MHGQIEYKGTNDEMMQGFGLRICQNLSEKKFKMVASSQKRK
jgi:hypothetical protein